MKTRHHWRILGWTAALALCSGSIGATAALRVQNQRLARIAAGAGLAEVKLDRLNDAVGLTGEQQAAIRRMLERAQGEIRRTASAAATEAAQVSRQLDEEIRPVLDAEQLRRYERFGEVRQRIRERWKDGERLNPEQREWLRDRIEQRYGARARNEGLPP